MSWIMVDVETDGSIPGDYSMISIGAVIVEEGLGKTFYSNIKPISKKYDAERLKFLKISREETLEYKDAKTVMIEFVNWVKSNSTGKARFISDNNGFDWMFVCWYLDHFVKDNPFGHSSANLPYLYKGLMKDISADFKHLIVTLHTHNALDDARGNAEALLALKKEFNLKI